MGISPRRRSVSSAAGLSLLVLLALSSCSLKKPSAPTWDVTLQVPLFNKTYELSGLLENADLKFFGPDSLYAISFEDSLDPVTVGTDITLDGFSDQVSSTVGEFDVPAGTSQQASIALDDLYPAVITGIPLVVPAADFDTVSVDLPDLDRFSQVTILTGSVDITITNQTRLELDSLTVRLRDDLAGQAVVLNVDVTQGGTSPLLDGETRMVSLPMDGLTLSNDLNLQTWGHTAGSGGTVVFDGSEGLIIDVQVGVLVVSSVTGDVDPLSFSFFETIALGDSSLINYAILSAGDFSLTLNNPLGIDLDLTVTLPDITDPGGTPLQFALSAPTGGMNTANQDLSGYRITPDPVTREVSFSVDVTSPGGSSVTLSAGDMVSVEADVGNLVVEEVNGILNPRTISVPSGSFELGDDAGNLLDELRQVNLAGAELELTLSSTIGFPASGNITLVGTGGTPAMVIFPLIFNAAPGTPGQPPVVTVTLISSDDDPSLLTFLNALPTTVSYSGDVTVGQAGVSGTVTSASSVGVGVRFSAPLAFELTQPLEFESDATESTGGADTPEEFDFREATLTYTISSTVGLPIYAEFASATDSASVSTSPAVRLALRIAKGGAAVADTTLVITRTQWDVLTSPGWSRFKITIPPTTPGDPFSISPSDQVTMRAWISVGATVRPGGGP